MDQTLLQITAQSQMIATIDVIYTGVGILVGILTIWGIMTRHINKRIDSKADKEVFESEIDNIKKDISKVELTQTEYAKTQKDILDKVTDIWQFLAAKSK